ARPQGAAVAGERQEGGCDGGGSEQGETSVLSHGRRLFQQTGSRENIQRAPGQQGTCGWGSFKQRRTARHAEVFTGEPRRSPCLAAPRSWTRCAPFPGSPG